MCGGLHGGCWRAVASSAGETRMIRSVLYVPQGVELWRWLAALTACGQGQGWHVGGYTRDWHELVNLLASGHYQVGLHASEAHLPPDRVPRLAAMDELVPPGSGLRRPTIHLPG